MKKPVMLVVLCLVVGLADLCPTVYAQNTKPAAAAPKDTLKTKPLLPLEMGEAVREESTTGINFTLPYSGMVELKLIDPDGKIVLNDQYIGKIGPNTLRLKNSGFKKTGRYTYYLWFKGKETKGFIDN